MKNKIGRLGTVLETALAAGILVLGLCAAASAQQTPPASQMPEEIPAQAGSQQGQAPQDDSGAGRISFIHGDVSTQHSGSSDWAAATLNTPVVNGDHISTGPDARLEVQLDHANILRLSGQTTANVVSLARTQMQLQVGQGLVNYDVLRDNQANIEIDTPNVAVHPDTGEGSYRIQVNSDGETIVDVRKGSADIATPQGSTHVNRDQRITIQGDADNAQYQLSGAPGRDDWDRWNSDRDHIIVSAQSWHHTNPYYTGSEDLDAYGHWEDVPDYGQVWFPAAGPDFVPYRDGRWVWEPYYGWTWVSYEPWGWAPYHYGRWFVYGGNWGWWPGPVYAGYYPVWAPAYVSFFGFGGGGWSFGFGFGGGFGNVGWLPCGPGDRFFPWYGRGITQVNVVNVTNIHNTTIINGRGIGPLRAGAFSNVDHVFNNDHVRAGFSSMQSGEFGRQRVPMHQSRFDPRAFRQAKMMTGANPISPARQSFMSTDRQVNPRTIPNRTQSNQRFFSSNPRANTSFRAGNNAGSSNRGGNFSNAPKNAERPGSNPPNRAFNGNVNRGPGPSTIQSSRPGWHSFNPPSNNQARTNGGRTFEAQGTPQANTSSHAGNNSGNLNRSGNVGNAPGNAGHPESNTPNRAFNGNVNRGPGPSTIQSSRPGWHNFTAPSGPQTNMSGGRTFESQGTPQPRSNFSRPAEPPRQFQNQNPNNSRGNFNNFSSNRPTLNMRQPIVTPRYGGSNPSRENRGGGNYSAPSGGRSYGGNGGGSSYPSRAPNYSAPSGRGGFGGNGGGGYRSAPPSGGSRGGFSGGGSRGGNFGGSRGGSSGGGHNRR